MCIQPPTEEHPFKKFKTSTDHIIQRTSLHEQSTDWGNSALTNRHLGHRRSTSIEGGSELAELFNPSIYRQSCNPHHGEKDNALPNRGRIVFSGIGELERIEAEAARINGPPSIGRREARRAMYARIVYYEEAS